MSICVLVLSDAFLITSHCDRYMKGRVTYEQLNSAVKSINTAVVAKYKILQQPVKNLSNAARKLHQCFKDQETKDTKGTVNDHLHLTPLKSNECYSCIFCKPNTGYVVSLWAQGSDWPV